LDTARALPPEQAVDQYTAIKIVPKEDRDGQVLVKLDVTKKDLKVIIGEDLQVKVLGEGSLFYESKYLKKLYIAQQLIIIFINFIYRQRRVESYSIGIGRIQSQRRGVFNLRFWTKIFILFVATWTCFAVQVLVKSGRGK